MKGLIFLLLIAITVVAVGTYGSYEKAPPQYQSDVRIMNLDAMPQEVSDLAFINTHISFEAIEERLYLGSTANLVTPLESNRWCSESALINMNISKQLVRRAIVYLPKLC